MLLRWKRLRSWTSRASRRGRRAARGHFPALERGQSGQTRVVRQMDAVWDGAVLGHRASLPERLRELRGFMRWLASG